LVFAGFIAALPPLAAQMAKESLVRGLDSPNLSGAPLVDLYRFMALEATEDKDEGQRAWREKRKPVFHGR
jgi:enoyl-CoA hydratase